MVPFNQLLYALTLLYFTGTGIIFILPLLFPSKESWEVVQSVLFRNFFSLSAGATGVLLLVLKLFFPRGGLVIFGDFLPVLVLALCSALHFSGYVRVSRSLDPRLKEKGAVILSGLQVPAGFVILAAGLIHLILAPIPVLCGKHDSLFKTSFVISSPRFPFPAHAVLCAEGVVRPMVDRLRHLGNPLPSDQLAFRSVGPSGEADH